MDAMLQRFQKMIWFLPLDRFAIGICLYMFAGTAMLSAQGGDIISAFLATLTSGVVLTAMFIAVRPMWILENRGRDESWRHRLLFGPLRLDRSKNDDSGAPKPDKEPDEEPSSGVEDEEFRQRMLKNRIDSAKRASRKMHDKVIHTGLVVVVYMLVFWLIAGSLADFFTTLFGGGGDSAASLFGAQGDISFDTPKDLFVFDWKVLAVLWFALIVLLPRWMIYILLVGMSGMRIVFLVFGPMASMWIMNMGQLPFFYGLMMIFMFGSIIYPFLRQIKYYRPGDATWGTPKGSMRGQPEVRATVETELAKLQDHIAGKSKRPPTRGMIFEGPPGTGKTLFAKEIATELNLPVVMTDGAALSGVPLISLVMEYIKWRTHSYAAEYGGVIFFMDEVEVLLAARQGMAGGGQPGGMERGNSHQGGIRDVWDLFSYDAVGTTSSCGVLYDSAEVRERFWETKSSLSLGKNPKTYTHKFFFPMGGMGIGGQAIYPFLTWLDGVGSPPAMETLKRRLANNILDGLFIPPAIPFTQKILRLSPAKTEEHTVLFIGATNRAFMLDPAIRRPGRMGVTARFKTPDIESRRDIITLYLQKANKDKLLRPELLEEAAIEEFARATSGMSPAEIEAAINSSYDVRVTHVKTMARIKALLDGGTNLDDLLDSDRKYWLRNKDEADLEDDRADMHALLEARNTLIYGRADPGLTTTEHREQTAIHEYWGHFIILKAALGDVMRPSVISIMPRGQALGMVAHIPVEERDPKPQRFYEGLLRVSVGSTVAERFFFGENQPGVSSDLENATRIVCFMIGKAGMAPYKCSSEERKKFLEIGETLIVSPEGASGALNPFAQNFVDRVLANPRSRERAAVMLGQAFVDDYRFIHVNAKKNFEFHKSVIAELLRLDELGGLKIEDVWNKLDDVLISWDALKDEQRSLWPEGIKQIENYFYNPSRRPEAEEVLS